MAESKTSAPVPLATEFELDGDSILFSEQSGDLFLLNPTAALVWQGLADGLETRDIAAALAEVTGQPVDVVLRDCEGLVADWQRAGLVSGGRADRPSAHGKRRPKPWWDERRPVAPVLEPGLSHDYRLVDFAFRLRTPDVPAGRRVHDLLAHLRIEGEVGTPSLLDVRAEEHRWSLRYNGRLVGECAGEESVVPMVHGNLVLVAYKKSDCLLALHAAAVLDNGGGILLAGVPGSGKSTLTSALMAGGYPYCADDTVLLSGSPIVARGVPTRLGIKEGSWPVVAELWPGFETLSTHLRADGQRIRYLPPPAEATAAAAQSGFAARLLVFPRFDQAAETRLQPLRRADALLRLTEAGYDIPTVISKDIVAQLVDWIAALDCYELVFRDVRDAVEKLGSVGQ